MDVRPFKWKLLKELHFFDVYIHLIQILEQNLSIFSLLSFHKEQSGDKKFVHVFGFLFCLSWKKSFKEIVLLWYKK